MNPYSPLAYFIVLTLILMLVKTPLFSVADQPWHPENSRTFTIDGLRGFLAISVFFHHAAVYYRYLLTGSWQLPPSVFYTQLGQSSVALFFMITGYLFWGKAIRTCGRLPWRNLYIGRLFRISPLYYLATLFMLLVVFLNTGLTIHESPAILWRELLPLSLLGFYEIAPMINTYQTPANILAGVIWTLHYEWLFYLLILPLAAIFARLRNGHIWFSIIGAVICLALVAISPGTKTVALADFFIGMTCASILEFKSATSRSTTNTAQSILVIVLLALLATQFQTAYAAIPVMILGLVFFLISSGCTVFSVLNRRSSRRLGEISYGIYILQGLALYAAFAYAPVRAFALGTVLHYWVIITIAGLFLTTTALAAHILIELPGIRMGQAIIRRFTENQPIKPVVPH